VTPSLHRWRTGEVIPGTEGMTGKGPIRVGDPGPLYGTAWNGECPFCEEVVYSSCRTHEEGLRQHIAIRHPAHATETGVRRPDPAHPGWDIVGDLDIPAVPERGQR
jgi:hypothetical protein